MKYRSRHQILLAMLKPLTDEEALSHGLSKTSLMYSGHLSYEQLNNYMKYCLDEGLIETRKGFKTYFLTTKGRNFTEQLQNAQRVLSNVKM